MIKKAELVFIPSPGIGHLLSTVEFAKCLVNRDDSLSIAILVIDRPGNTVPALEAMIQSLAASDTQIRCIKIPPVEPVPPFSKVSEKFLSDFIAIHKPQVEHVIKTELLSDDSVQISGLVLDLFCTSMIDVANQLNIPSYIFLTSGAAFLGFMLYVPVHHLQFGANRFDPSDHVELVIPSYENRVPGNIIPSFAIEKDGYSAFLYHGTRFKEAKGFIINTFAELEPYAIDSLTITLPSVYPVGPLLDLNTKERSAGIGSKWDGIRTWLDDQLPSSVVFLCFGSRGCFHGPQLEQIAIALEASGKQFLWSIRRPPVEGSFELPKDYQNVQEVLPDGFLERTEKNGKVCGWAPQVEVLAHPAIGGFVSHCGWNSILESIWFGVPIATWPLYAEQQLNAFQLVRELGLAVELKIDYHLNSGEVVKADVIERAITCLMDGDNPVRKRAKEMSDKSRKVAMDGGSSSNSLRRLIDDLKGNIKAI